MSQPYQQSGFNIRSAPGAGGYAQQQYYPAQPGTAGYQEYVKQNGQAQNNEEHVRTSTATGHTIFGAIEIGTGIAANFIQMGTTIFSFIQIQLGVHNLIFQTYGPWGGWSYVSTHNPAYIWISIIIAIGAQILLQMGCHVLSGKWKKDNLAIRQNNQSYGFVQVLLSKEAGWFFTGLGFVLDAVGDLGFAIAFAVPWYVCILFALLMYGLSTVVLYDGDERFHYAYPIWWSIHQARKLWKQAALERARLMHGVSPDGRSLVPSR